MTTTKLETAHLLDRLASDREGQLIDEYERWCREQGLPHVDAMELSLHDLTDEQHEWLHDFIDRWESWEELDREVYEQYRAA